MDRQEIKRKIKDTLTIYDLLNGDTDHKAKLIRCPIPGHEDKNPSFSIFAGGKLGECKSQCGRFDIIALYQKMNGVGFNDALKALAQTAGIPFPENGNGNGTKGSMTKKIEATYDYKDMVKNIGDIKLFSAKDLSKALEVNERTIRDWFNKGRLKGVKIGTEWQITEENLKKFLNAEDKPEPAKPTKAKRKLRSFKK